MIAGTARINSSHIHPVIMKPINGPYDETDAGPAKRKKNTKLAIPPKPPANMNNSPRTLTWFSNYQSTSIS